MAYPVLLTEGAARDLSEIDRYIRAHDGPERADHVLDRLESLLSSLSELPQRGNHPPELATLGIQDYREVFFKPYRVIYRLRDERVYVYVVADGRRDMQALLQRRLLASSCRGA